MSIPELDAHLGRVRELTQQYLAGNAESFAGFRELAQFLLGLTVLHSDIGVRLVYGPRGTDRAIVEGALGEQNDILRLTDGRYLRLSIGLYMEPHRAGHRLKVEKSIYQYQLDDVGARWIFRYDYLRRPPDPHPAAHLQLRGALHESILDRREPLERVHFPTGRVSLEAVIRLLVEQFGVPTNTEARVWRRVLAESEGAFLNIAHRPLSGPLG